MYNVITSEYVNKKCFKKYKKKYPTSWDITLESIKSMFEYLENYILSQKLHIICDNNEWLLIKWEFSIEWSKTSAKSSWNRIIAYIDKVSNLCMILLIYSKNDIRWNKETEWWKSIIKKNNIDICSKFMWFL